MQRRSQVLSGLMGLCVGDALGGPVVYQTREQLSFTPVTAMLGYGTYNQPPGTWSDDTSLTLCLADALCDGFSLETIAQSFCLWFRENHWTPHGKVFDIGSTTRRAIWLLQQGIDPAQAGSTNERSNGNGSLMRSLPLSFYYKVLPFQQLIDRVHEVSRITHCHLRSQIACGIYISIVVCLLQGYQPKQAYSEGIRKIKNIYDHLELEAELRHFERVFSGRVHELPKDLIRSSGYVIDTLEAALWCLLNTSSYRKAVLEAVNLGQDTNTTAAVTGSLAGIYYGVDNIPSEWLEKITRKQDIIELCYRLELSLRKEEDNLWKIVAT